jgi:hypothetical protein
MKSMARTARNDETIQGGSEGPNPSPRTWEGTPLWRAVEKAVADLVQNRDLVEDEYREYVVGYICKIIERRRQQSSLNCGATLIPS